jgi:hypothetical protein
MFAQIESRPEGHADSIAASSSGSPADFLAELLLEFLFELPALFF